MSDPTFSDIDFKNEMDWVTQFASQLPLITDEFFELTRTIVARVSGRDAFIVHLFRWSWCKKLVWTHLKYHIWYESYRMLCFDVPK